MKHLPKHLQPRYRYLAVELRASDHLSCSKESVQSACWRAARQLLGDRGSARIGLKVVKFRHQGQSIEMVVRVRRNTTSAARAALCCITNVDETSVGVYIRGTSGTIRSCEEKYLGRPPL